MLMVNHLSGFGAWQDSQAAYYDEFVGANNTILSSHTSDSGHIYTKGLNTSTMTANLYLDGSGAVKGQGSSWSGFKANGVELQTGERFKISATVPIASGAFHCAGITFAWADSSTDEYFMWLQYYNTTADRVRLIAKHNTTDLLVTEITPSERPTSLYVEKLSDGTFDLYYNSIFWRNADPVAIYGSGNGGNALGLHIYQTSARISRAEVI